MNKTFYVLWMTRCNHFLHLYVMPLVSFVCILIDTSLTFHACSFLHTRQETAEKRLKKKKTNNECLRCWRNISFVIWTEQHMFNCGVLPKHSRNTNANIVDRKRSYVKAFYPLNVLGTNTHISMLSFYLLNVLQNFIALGRPIVR